MHGESCPECGYSSHDLNNTDYHNQCLLERFEKSTKLAFALGVAASFVFLGCLLGYFLVFKGGQVTLTEKELACLAGVVSSMIYRWWRKK